MCIQSYPENIFTFVLVHIQNICTYNLVVEKGDMGVEII